MVDYYGNWTSENDYSVFPKNKWCDYDYVANWIIGLGYIPKTSMENLATNIFLHYDGYLTDNNVEFYTDMKESENEFMVSIKDISCFVEDNGGLQEFDYAY